MPTKRKLKVEDFCAIRQVSGPQISPDGDSIAFYVSDPLPRENTYLTHVYIAELDGEPRQLTREGSNNRSPIWSPSGAEIVFLSNLDGREGLWRITPDGGVSERIGGVGESLSNLRWSPDSEKILFLARLPQGEQRRSDVQVIRRLPYKLNGLGFLGDRWRHLFVLDVKGGETEQVTEGEYDISAAAWSPKSSDLAYIANKSGDAPFTQKNDIWTANLGSGAHRRLTDGSRSFNSLSYSPDGEWIAAVGNTGKYGGATKNDVYAINLKTGEERNHTAEIDSKVGDQVIGGTGVGIAGTGVGIDLSPVWTFDSKAVFFLTAVGGNGNIYKVSLETKEVELISDTARTIQSYSFSRDQRAMAFSATDVVSPSEIWVTEGGRSRRVTRFNDGLMGKVMLSKGEKLTFRAGDGVPVDGWLYPPVERAETKNPMVLLVKGGPHTAAFGNAFCFDAQVLAAEGYVVLYTNERGSGGYGEEFARTARARFYGERDFRDIMEAIDFAVKKYPVDEKRLGVMGYSRGGFLTNWIVTHTDRFRAAITAGGFCDVYSFFGTGDNTYGWCEKNYEGTPWDDEELYMSKSPLRYVKNVVTPTMIIHGMDDQKAPLSQAEQLYVSLKRLGKETELVLFPGESHELPRSPTPEHMMEYHRHVLRWFNRHLKGNPSEGG